MGDRDPWAGIEEWDPFATHPVRESVRVGGRTLRVGDPVRIAPQGNADIMDIALRGRTAVIESIEVDFEDTVHLAVVLDDDPGRDLGLERQVGHRFFYRLEDVEPLPSHPTDSAPDHREFCGGDSPRSVPGIASQGLEPPPSGAPE